MTKAAAQVGGFGPGGVRITPERRRQLFKLLALRYAATDYSTELWLPVVGWEEWYEISDFGRVRRISAAPGTRAGRLLKGSIDAWGYIVAGLSRDGKSRLHKVHTLALTTFVGPCPDGMQCRHLDGDTTNPALQNLVWGSPKDNAADMLVHGRRVVGEDHYMVRLSASDVVNLRSGKVSRKEVERRTGANRTTVRDAHNGKSWKWLEATT